MTILKISLSVNTLKQDITFAFHSIHNSQNHHHHRRRRRRQTTMIHHLLIIQLTFTILTVGNSYTRTQEFYPDERDALIPFRDSMHSDQNLHRNWTGPPCRNNTSRWIGITCSDSHITQLTLESINLTGKLPTGFLQNVTFLTKLSFHNNGITGDLPKLTNLRRLQFVFLSGNRFSGDIPVDYTQLPNITTLELQENEITGRIPPFNQDSLIVFNLSYNQLSGPIPETKILERFDVSSFDHNPGLCGRPLEIQCAVSPSPSPSQDKKQPLEVWSIVLIAAATLIVPLFVISVLVWCYRRDEERHLQATEGVEKKSQWSASTGDPEKTVDLEFFDKRQRVFDLDELLRASAEVLGPGSLGTTYKAVLESGTVVAVKRVKEMNSLNKKEFVHQMQLLGTLRHENLVEMISFYYSKDEKLVVREFIQHGSLFELLHGSRGIGRIPLNWSTRLKIMKDVAKGLAFLHTSLSSQKAPHANLKSSNILVEFTNKTARAKLTDFGYLPLLPSQKSKLAIGKCPEGMDGKKLTHKSDVYCFGMLLLEVITGKSNNNNSEDLSDWVRNVVNSDWSTDIFDLEIVVEKEGHEDMLKIAEMALECTDASPERRPDMTQILTRLEEIHHTPSSTEHRG